MCFLCLCIIGVAAVFCFACLLEVWGHGGCVGADGCVRLLPCGARGVVWCPLLLQQHPLSPGIMRRCQSAWQGVVRTVWCVMKKACFCCGGVCFQGSGVLECVCSCFALLLFTLIVTSFGYKARSVSAHLACVVLVARCVVESVRCHAHSQFGS